MEGRGGGGRDQHMFIEKKTIKSKQEKKIPPLPNTGTKQEAWPQALEHTLSAKSPPNQGKEPETGQLLIEYNINYRVHH